MSSCLSIKFDESPFPLHLNLEPMMDNLPTIRHFLAAGTASAVASGTFNPLDCLRVRWQTQLGAKEQSILAFGHRIVQQEGLWQGLWKPGVGVNMIGMATASGLRFGYYETIRNGLRHSAGVHHEKEAWHMVVAGLVSGGSAYFLTTPFHLLKTRIQSEAGRHRQSKTLMEGVIQIVSQTGSLSSLFKGSGPLAVRGSLFTAGQMVGYDGLKTTAKKHGYVDGPWLHVASSIFSAFCASLASAPADYIMARYMSCSENKTVGQCVRLIYNEGGVLAFWKGWSVFFIRLTPVLLTYSSVYEQLRFHLGLGFLD